MFRPLLCTLTLSLMLMLSGYSEAGRIQSLRDSSHRIQAVVSTQGGHLIEVCGEQAGQCRVYPDPNAELYGFSGELAQWQQLFNDCASMEDLNALVSATQAVSTVALFWSYGWVKGVAASSAWFAAQPGALFGSTAYPEISRESVHEALSPINFVLTREGHPLFFRPEFLEAVEEILAVCTNDFSSWMRQINHHQCMQGCHK